MKNKEEIRLYLDTQFSASEDDMVQIVRNDFDRILRYCSKECVWGINKKVYRSFRFVEANQQKLKKE